MILELKNFNYRAKSKSLDLGKLLTPISGVSGDAFALLWEFGLNIPKIWQ